MLLHNKEDKILGKIEINLTPLKAIKKHCFECSGYEKKQVRECKITDCVLFIYRLGSNPNRKGCTIPKNTASTSVFKNTDGYDSVPLVQSENEW